jgi:hypothetical protein
MTGWREEVAGALADFAAVAQRARAPFDPAEVTAELHDAPHRPPSRLPVGKMAVYGFHYDGAWLKIGKAGAKSQARYTSQHYNPASAASTLAASLLHDPAMAVAPGFDPARPGEWIKARCARVNILLPEASGRPILALLEAFLHARLKPRYEG